MAISSYKTFLMYKEKDGEAYTKLIDVKSFPALGGDPELLDVTTTSDPIRKYVAGIQELDSLTFTANYDKTDLQKLIGMKDKEYDFSVWFGGTETAGVATPTGSEGKWNFSGTLTVHPDAFGVNEPVDITFTIANSTTITTDFTASSLV